VCGTRELINFAKRRAIYEVISQVLYFRDEPYTFKVLSSPPLSSSSDGDGQSHTHAHQVDQAVGDSLVMMLSSRVGIRIADMQDTSRQIEP
jgi:hypothetical protein